VDRTIESQLQHRFYSGALTLILLAVCLLSCRRTLIQFISPPLQLNFHQVARLTVRYSLFCAGGHSVEATLAFSNGAGRRLVEKTVILSCGDIIQLDLDGKLTGRTRIVAILQLDRRTLHAPDAVVEIINLGAAGTETSVMHAMRLKSAPGDISQTGKSAYLP
jgi:hypothetical protein